MSAPRLSSTCARAPCAPRTASRTPARRPQPPPLSECSGASRRRADRRARPPRRPRGWAQQPRRRGHSASVAERGGAAQGSGAWRRPARFGGLYRDRVRVRRLGGPGSAGGAGVGGEGPGARLAAHADDQVAAAVLLHQLAALGAGLGVGGQPVLGLAVVLALYLPAPPPAHSPCSID